MDQVVSHHVQAEYGADLDLALPFELAQPTELLDPAQQLFDAPLHMDGLGVAPYVVALVG